jgi:hypothetical protein
LSAQCQHTDKLPHSVVFTIQLSPSVETMRGCCPAG